MRKFLKSAGLAAVSLGLAVAATAGGVQAQQKVLKMQATWPASLTLYENFQMWAERVDKLSGGTLKIEAMPAGQVVPAFEVLDATHKKCSTAPTPGAATGPARTRPRSSSPAARAARSAWTTPTTSAGCTSAAAGTSIKSSSKAAQAQRRRVPDLALRSASVRLVQEADPNGRGHEGYEVPPNRHRRRGMAGDGLHRRQHARR